MNQIPVQVAPEVRPESAERPSSRTFRRGKIPILRSETDIKIERAAKALSIYTGQDMGLWTRVLRWRVRHFGGDLSRALCARDGSQSVFSL